MWIWIAKNFSKFHAKRLNRSENIPKSFRGLLFLKRPVELVATQFAIDAANQHKEVRCDVMQLPVPIPWPGLIHSFIKRLTLL